MSYNINLVTTGMFLSHLRKKLIKLPRVAVCLAISSRVRGNFGEEFALRGREVKVKRV